MADLANEGKHSDCDGELNLIHSEFNCVLGCQKGVGSLIQRTDQSRPCAE